MGRATAYRSEPFRFMHPGYWAVFQLSAGGLVVLASQVSWVQLCLLPPPKISKWKS
jgi:hypothetical protein